ncbi:MAG: hypothetical protein AABX07_06340, partial [Nanoarchaeota archaeon]
ENSTFQAQCAQLFSSMTIFEVIIEDYSKKDDSLWNLILGGEKTISDKEAKKMNETLKKMRKEKGFRNGFGL